jgi:UDP-glucose 4-epimerase
VRDYIHVSDLVAAHGQALGHLRSGGASMVANCGYGRGYSVLEVLEAVQQVAGKPLDVRYAARRPGDAEAIVADPSRARKELGWKAEYDDLPRIVAHALDWERSLGRRNRV